MFSSVRCSWCFVRSSSGSRKTAKCHFSSCQRILKHSWGKDSKSVGSNYVGRHHVPQAGRTHANLLQFQQLPSRVLCSESTTVEKKHGMDIYSSIDYDAITGGDETLIKRLKIIALEVEVSRQEGHRVPEFMSVERWRDLLALETKSKRLRQLAFWWMNEKKRESDKRKKEQKKQEREEELAKKNREAPPDDGHIRYGFGGSTIFIRIYDSKIDSMYNNKLVQAMQFGQDLVIDCSYDSYMNVKEASNCAKQMMIMFSENRLREEPFNMHFCSASPQDSVMTRLHKLIPTMYDDSYPMNITPKSHLELFPKERLVYLTPHCREELVTYSHEDVYIIGAMVDKVNNEPLSLAKAKSQGLRMAKLPLDRYLAWGYGNKSLTLNQVLAILLDLKSNGGDWLAALQRNVPKRKVVTREQAEREISARIKKERKRRDLSYF